MECKDPFKNCDDWDCIKNGCQSDAGARPSIEIENLTDPRLLVVHHIEEHEDGTATLTVDIGSAALRTIVEVGLITIIKNGIKNAALEGKE